MKKRGVIAIVAVLAFLLALTGCTSLFGPQSNLSSSPQAADQAGKDYLVMMKGNRLPADFDREVTAAGGAVKEEFATIGAAVVTAKSATFVDEIAALPAVKYVLPDVKLNWLPGEDYVNVLPADQAGPAAGGVASQSIGDDEWFFNAYQWSMFAIDAPAAWDAGYTGAGVRVAVLDSGIDYTHPDLAPNVNTALSTSFVPYEPYIDDEAGHGTHVAGIIAAAHNEFGSIGVAPDAELVAVKVLDHTGSGNFSWLIQGLLYANAVGAKVINMSLGAYLPRSGFITEDGTKVGANEVAGLTSLLTRVIDYVWQNGTFVVAAAGNDAANLTGDASWISIPAESGRTVSVSATGPQGWGIDPTVSLDTPAYIYTNYGTGVDYAAPGGNVDPSLYPDGPWYYDLVFSTYPGGWAWMAGTSMASPHVAGIAALILQATPGASPNRVESILRGSSDDLGKPGRDPWYGLGRVNAAQAVK
ncbi:S8 family serine peptidase [Candidatus Bipolaricaulota bacterium]|nr:S8 family serine peptidase [Candidatus Bipolaricaulota bacterium]